jgi:hypothetical protein
VKHVSTAVWAPPGFLQWHGVALQWPKCTQCTAQHRQQAQQCVQGTYCGGWRRCACLDAKTRVLAVKALASTTCNNFIADLLFLSEVPHPLLVAGAPCVNPYLIFGGTGPAYHLLGNEPILRLLAWQITQPRRSTHTNTIHRKGPACGD